MIVPQAVSADSFVNTIGINTHLHYTDTVYYNNFNTIVKPSLIDLGVRHVRDGAMTYPGIDANSFYYKRVRALANEGIRFTFITQSLDTPWTEPTNYSLLDEVYTWSEGAISAFEAVNEPDIQGVDSWIPATLQGQEQLYNTVNSDPNLQTIPVIGPSIIDPDSTEKVGDLSELLDFGNIHNYFAGRHPETPGWGDNGYGSVAWNLAQASNISGSDPIMATETGWHNTRNDQGDIVGIPQDVEAKYIPRLFLTHFNAGIARTYLYELIDVRDQPTDRESNFGLLDNDGSPQPGYFALKNLIDLLADPGPAFTPIPLGVSLEGQTNKVESTLLQKRDGTYYLALWLGKSSWDPNAKRRIEVPHQSVTVTLPGAFTSATLHRFRKDGTVKAATAAMTNGQLTLNVRDAVTLVELPTPLAYVPQAATLASDSLTNISDRMALLPDLAMTSGDTASAAPSLQVSPARVDAVSPGPDIVAYGPVGVNPAYGDMEVSPGFPLPASEVIGAQTPALF